MNTIPTPANILDTMREYTAYRTNCRNHAEAASMFDAIHAESLVCIDNLLGMAERAVDRNDANVVATLLSEARSHDQVRTHIESLWTPAGAQ